MDRLKLPVNEIYGPVCQGEGPHVGRPVWFLRLGGCNLSCAWCDTPYTWDATRYELDVENRDLDAAQINALLPSDGTVVLSGGEPLIHAHNPTLRAVMSERSWHVETNGTIIPPDWMRDLVAHWSVSPKLGHAGDPDKRRVKPAALAAFADMPQAVFKIVAGNRDDLDEIRDLVRRFDIAPGRVWVMAEGTTASSQIAGMRTLEQAVVAAGWNLSVRLHVLMHDNERGT